MKELLALGRSLRAPIPYEDERGIPCLRVPLDDEGREYATIELADYEHIVEELGCRAPWYMASNGHGRRYVAVNVPATDDHKEGLVTVARLLPGVGRHRVSFATDETRDLRRPNLRIAKGGKGSLRDCGKLMAEAVQRQRTAKLKRGSASD